MKVNKAKYTSGTTCTVLTPADWDRVRRMLRMMDIRNVFVTRGQILQAQELIRKYEDANASATAWEATATTPGASISGAKQKQHTPMNKEERMQLERAHEIVESCVHPDTKRPVSPSFLRISFIIPANMTLDAGKKTSEIWFETIHRYTVYIQGMQG